mgnify:CR=1 FL=1
MSDTPLIAEENQPDPVESSDAAVQPAKASIAELSPAACAAKLAELFPAVFSAGAPKPLDDFGSDWRRDCGVPAGETLHPAGVEWPLVAGTPKYAGAASVDRVGETTRAPSDD